MYQKTQTLIVVYLEDKKGLSEILLKATIFFTYVCMGVV